MQRDPPSECAAYAGILRDMERIQQADSIRDWNLITTPLVDTLQRSFSQCLTQEYSIHENEKGKGKEKEIEEKRLQAIQEKKECIRKNTPF